jgi:hypothetical protein
VDVAYLPASLEVRRQAAERMRNRDGADEYAERLVALSRQ